MDKLSSVRNSFDDRFELRTTFKLKVPDDYDHATRLATFAKENRDKFCYYDDAITDKNFMETVQKLIPGKTYIVEIFWIVQRVTSEECLAFLSTRKTILVGAQGLSLAWQYQRECLPERKWLVSFNKKGDLLDRCGRTPSISLSLNGWEFTIGGFGSDWYDNGYLFCIRDK